MKRYFPHVLVYVRIRRKAMPGTSKYYPKTQSEKIKITVQNYKKMSSAFSKESYLNQSPCAPYKKIKSTHKRKIYAKMCGTVSSMLSGLKTYV